MGNFSEQSRSVRRFLSKSPQEETLRLFCTGPDDKILCVFDLYLYIKDAWSLDNRGLDKEEIVALLKLFFDKQVVNKIFLGEASIEVYRDAADLIIEFLNEEKRVG